MTVKVVFGWNDPEFHIYENVFWNFTPDDWDYMIIGENQYEVERIAERMQVCDYQIKQIGDRWIAVTYHS